MQNHGYGSETPPGEVNVLKIIEGQFFFLKQTPCERGTKGKKEASHCRAQEDTFINKCQEETHIIRTKHVKSVSRSVTGLFEPPSHDICRTFCQGKEALPVPLL
jgi:hypothetical protein